MATIGHQRNPFRARLPPGRVVRPFRLPYHLAYAASTASQTPSEPDISALPKKRTFQLCSNKSLPSVSSGRANVVQ